MTPTRVRQSFSLSPMALIRALLDLSLIGSWIWLASDSLPQPLPALGGALFGAASAGYWAMSNFAQKPRSQEEEIPREEEFARLNRFPSQAVKEPASAGGQWFEHPALGNKMLAEAERCAKLALPLSVIFFRTRPGSLADWAEGPAPRTLSDVLTQVLDRSRQKYMCGPKGSEAVIAFAGGDRPAAAELAKRLSCQFNSAECEAGIVMHPEDGIEPTAMASVARLRLRPVEESSGVEASSATDQEGASEDIHTFGLGSDSSQSVAVK